MIEQMKGPAAERPKIVDIGVVKAHWQIEQVQLPNFRDTSLPLQEADFSKIEAALKEGGTGAWDTTFKADGPRPDAALKLEGKALQAARQMVDLCNELKIPADVEVKYDITHLPGENILNSCTVSVVIRRVTSNPQTE